MVGCEDINLFKEEVETGIWQLDRTGSSLLINAGATLPQWDGTSRVYGWKKIRGGFAVLR